MSKCKSFVRVGTAYLLAFAVAAVWLTWGTASPQLWLDTVIADVLATLVIFTFSRYYENSSFYDAYWSVVPPALLIYWWARGDAALDSVHCWLVAVVVVVWAIRLTVNWAIGFPGLHHEDWRYRLLRDNAGRGEFFADLFEIHLVPTAQVFLGMIPVYVAVTRPDGNVGWLSVVAFVVGIGAVALEFAADGQLRSFVRQARSGQVMDRGLWSWSRHPNYFGEFAFWVSMALFGIAAAPSSWWWLVVGVVAMLAMFLGASIPMMEKRSLERRPSYQSVIDTVPKFVPRPPRKTVG